MALFVDRGALKCGMTQMMIQHMSKQHTMLLHGGKTVKTIGSADGVPADVIDRCFTRMQKWARLALDVVQAEWPAFEIVQATSIFNLSRKQHATLESFCGTPGTTLDDCIMRLAGFLGADPELM